jgi:hypothetical protein
MKPTLVIWAMSNFLFYPKYNIRLPQAYHLLYLAHSLGAYMNTYSRDENGSDTDGYYGYRYFFFLGKNSLIEYGYRQYIFCQKVIFIIFGS